MTGLIVAGVIITAIIGFGGAFVGMMTEPDVW